MKVPHKNLAINFLRAEIDRCIMLGVNKIVLHPGSALTIDRNIAIKNIYMALKKGAQATIYIHEPILVLHEYDARTLEANAELAGFKDIKTGTANVFNEDLGTKIETITFTLTK